MNNRSGQVVVTIGTHNIPQIRVDPTVEEWEISRRRWQVWGGFPETFKQLDFQNGDRYGRSLWSEWRNWWGTKHTQSLASSNGVRRWYGCYPFNKVHHVERKNKKWWCSDSHITGIHRWMRPRFGYVVHLIIFFILTRGIVHICRRFGNLIVWRFLETPLRPVSVAGWFLILLPLDQHEFWVCCVSL